MEIIYHGHSCIQIITENNSIIIDPFISGNPNAKTKVEDIKVDYILLTHGHDDHTLDAEAIAKNNDATVIANVELATYMEWKGLKIDPMNIGGQIKLDSFNVKMIKAFHSSGVVLSEEKQIQYLGMPGGFIIEIDGKKILHAGDTSLHQDMKMIGDLYSIDLALLPIGDRFTMGIDDAAIAAEWIDAKTTIPIHYNTFPFIVQDPDQYVHKLKDKGLHGVVLETGESFELK